MALQLPGPLANLPGPAGVWVAGAGGAALGGVTLVRRRHAGTGTSTTGASSSTTGAGTATTYTPGQLGSYDSSATDAYANFQTALDNSLISFQKQITDLQDQIAKRPTQPVTPKPPGPAPKPSRKPPPKHVPIPPRPAPVQRPTPVPKPPRKPRPAGPIKRPPVVKKR